MGEKDSVRYTEKRIRDRFYFRYTLCHHGALADGGLSLYSSGVATTIHFLYPVVVSLIMFVFYKDKLTMPILLAMAMAVSGVYMLSGGNTPGSSINIKGLMLVLATVIAYAAYIVGMNRSRIARLDSLKATFYILLSGAIVFLVNLAIKVIFPTRCRIWPQR